MKSEIFTFCRELFKLIGHAAFLAALVLTIID